MLRVGGEAGRQVQYMLGLDPGCVESSGIEVER